MQWFIFGIALFLSGIAYVRTEGFAPYKIAPALSEQSVASTLAVKEALSQPFRYLGKGRQCFVFVSQDDRYVLKFFNRSYFEKPWYFAGEKERLKREKRRFFFEHSYPLAWKEFGEEILFVHLGKSTDFPTLHIKGPASFSFPVNLNTTAFVLQRKAEPFYAGLQKIYQNEGILGLKRELAAFSSQIAARIEKRIADDDSDVEHNWGYVDGKLIHLDPGRLYFDASLEDPKRQEQEWHTATRHFFQWLAKTYPESS